MKAPGIAFDDPVLAKDPQSDHMSTMSDNGGVHINSGHSKQGVYLAATDIGGHAWEKAGKVWYEAVRDPRVVRGIKFVDFANVTIDVANRLPGLKKNEAKGIADAWAAVGVVPMMLKGGIAAIRDIRSAADLLAVCVAGLMAMRITVSMPSTGVFYAPGLDRAIVIDVDQLPADVA